VEDDMGLSFSMASTPAVAHRKKNKLSRFFTDIREKHVTPKTEPTLANLPMHEYVSRGWDATNRQWRNALWTGLDRNFRITDRERTNPVWLLGWIPQDDKDFDDSEPPDEDEEEEEEEEEMPVDEI
jgi:hypothetical protein